MFKLRSLSLLLCSGLLLSSAYENTFALPASEDASALEKHISYFAGWEGFITRDTIQANLIKLGFGHTLAHDIADKASYFGGLLIHGCPYATFTAKEGVGVLNHPRDTSIFGTDGKINEERWQKLLTYSEMDGGMQIITEKRFYEFLKWSRDNDTRPDPTGTAEIFSNAEWHDFFNFVTDHWKKSGDDHERSVTLHTLRKFYENTPAVFDRIKNHYLPIPKPSGHVEDCPSVHSIAQQGVNAAMSVPGNPDAWTVGRSGAKYDTNRFWNFSMAYIYFGDARDALAEGDRLLKTLVLVQGPAAANEAPKTCIYMSSSNDLMVMASEEPVTVAKLKKGFAQIKRPA